MNQQKIIMPARHAVPDDLFVRCPLQRFLLRQARGVCPDCPHYGGFIEVTGNEALAFSDRYRLVCGCPIHRELIPVEVPRAGAE